MVNANTSQAAAIAAAKAAAEAAARAMMPSDFLIKDRNLRARSSSAEGVVKHVPLRGGPRATVVISGRIPAGNQVFLDVSEASVVGQTLIALPGTTQSRTYVSGSEGVTEFHDSIVMPDVESRSVMVTARVGRLVEDDGEEALAQNVTIAVHSEPYRHRETPQGKQQVVVNPARPGTSTAFSSSTHAIQPLLPGGVTNPLWASREKLTVTLPADQDTPVTRRVSVVGHREVNDIQLSWDAGADGFGHHDHAVVNIEIPANLSTVDDADAGAYTPVAEGAGGYMLVPANFPAPSAEGFWIVPGGARNVVLDKSKAIPVETPGKGYFDLDPDTGLLTDARNPGKADWSLCTVSLYPAQPPVDVSLGDPRGVMMVDPYKAQFVHERYNILLTIEPAAAKSVDRTVSMWSMMFPRA